MELIAAESGWTERIWTSLRQYGAEAVDAVPTFLMAIVVFLAFVVGASIARNVASGFASRVTDDESLKNLFGTIARIGVLVIGTFVAAGVLFPGLSAGHLVSVLGLSSVAIGFAFKDIFENFLAGILILAQRPFQIDDTIIAAGYEGTVEDVTVRSTLLRTYDGERVIIPNAQIYSSPVQVRTAYEARRTRLDTGIGYGEDVEAGREVIREALESCETILDDPPPQVVVTGHGDSAVTFQLRFWTDTQTGDVVAAKDEVATRVKSALDEADIEIPYPYRSVEFYDMSAGGADAA